MSFKPDQPSRRRPTPQVQTEAQRKASQAEKAHNDKIGKPALAGAVAIAVGLSPIASEHLIPHDKNDPSFADYLKKQISSGADVQQANADELKKQGILLSKERGGSVVVTIPTVPDRTEPTAASMNQEYERAMRTIEPTQSNPYTTLIFETKELNRHFDGTKALGGLLKAWLGSEPVGNERQVTPAALIKSMLEKASVNNPAMQRVLSETFFSDAMIQHFETEITRSPDVAPLLSSAIASKDAPTMAAAWYELKLRNSHVQQAGGRGGGINRTSLSELSTSYNSFRSLTYPNSPVAQEAIMKRFNLDTDTYKVFLEYIQAMDYDIFGALPYTEMIPGNDWNANREVMEVILDRLGGDFAALMPTFAGTKKRPSSALGIYQNTESNAVAQASFFWPLVYSTQSTPVSHADVFLNHSNPLHSEMAIAYFDKWFHIIDFIKRSGIEKSRILLNPKYKTEFAQFMASLHYQPETGKDSADAWTEHVLAAQVAGTDPTRSLLSFVPRATSEQEAGAVDDLHIYMERNANHAKALAEKLNPTPTTELASDQEPP